MEKTITQDGSHGTKQTLEDAPCGQHPQSRRPRHSRGVGNFQNNPQHNTFCYRIDVLTEQGDELDALIY